MNARSGQHLTADLQADTRVSRKLWVFELCVSSRLTCLVCVWGSSLLGNVLRVDRANERKERPAFDSRPPPSRYEGEQESVCLFVFNSACC
jgi:hypothetical protein